MPAVVTKAKMLKELRDKFGDTVTTGQLGQYNRDYLRRAREGEIELLQRGIWALVPNAQVLKAARTNVADDDDDDDANVEDNVVDPAKIKKRFQMLEVLGGGMIAGNIRSLIVAGSAGVGKTFTLERQLERAEINGKIKSYEATKGSISAVGLYETLYRNRAKGQVTLLDDVDRVFYDEEALNILKAALDTSAKRTISWSKASRYLSDQDIPNRFDYEGQIIFITNLNLDRIAAKGGRLAPHILALMSRSIFLDLAIHNKKAIMVRIEQVLSESTLAEDLGLTKAQAKDAVRWMTDNLDRVRSLSIRTVNQISGFIKTDAANWKDMPEVTLLTGQ